MIHDPLICQCEKDAAMLDDARVPLGYDVPSLKPPGCQCGCDRCQSHRWLIGGIVEREQLKDRLTRNGINPDVLADLVWQSFFRDRLDVWMTGKITSAIAEQLAKVQLRSVVSITRESIQGLS